MEHKITLGASKFVGMQEQFNAKEQVILVFESSEYELDELRVTITDGASTYLHTLTGARFDITDYCAKEGILEIAVDLVKKGSVVKRWLIEPFVVRENGGTYELIPEIALLRNEIRTMKQIIKELNSKIYETM
jgi:hypothetical protein